MRGVWHPRDRASSRYHYLPIPEAGTQFRVELEYDRRAGVIDLGLFDAAGRFHGYSGGARDSFTVTASFATPGYLPGEVDGPVVFFGLHRIPPTGLPWSLSIGPPSARPAAEAPPVPQRPPRRPDVPPGWHAGDLHAHTVHSDGALTVDRLAAQAVAAGLDFLAVTDHNTVSHHAELAAASRRYGVTLIPGQEVTTDLGHANAFGDIGWVDFRSPPSQWPGLLSINHPLAADCAWRHPLAARPPLAEIWHSGWWDRTWSAPLAWLLAWAPETIPVGGSDFHTPGEQVLGQPTTWVFADSPSTSDILSALAAGRTAVSASPSAESPLLLRSPGGLLALGADGLLLTDFTGRRQPVRGRAWRTPAMEGVAWLEDHRTQVMAIG